MVRLIGVEPKGEAGFTMLHRTKPGEANIFEKGPIMYWTMDMETYDEPGPAGGEANVKKTIKL